MTEHVGRRETRRRRKRDTVRGVTRTLGRGVARGLVTPLHLRRRPRQQVGTAGLTAEQLSQLEVEQQQPVTVVRTDFNLEAVDIAVSAPDARVEGVVPPPSPKVYPAGQTARLQPEHDDDPHEPPMPSPARGSDPRTWIALDGLDDPQVLAELSRRYDIHPLAMEDVVNVPQRPKVEAFSARRNARAPLFIVARLIEFDGERLRIEQASLLVGPDLVVSILEHPSDVWDSVTERIETPGARLRRFGVGFLVYALLDALVDRYQPVIEHYAERLLELEDDVIIRPRQGTIQQIHGIKRDLMMLRREIAPMRVMLKELHDAESPIIDDTTQTFLRDVIDHCVQAVDAIDTQREVAVGLADTWMNAMSTKMNEVMKVLTLIASLLLPASFLAGVFGMNFAWLPWQDDPNGFWYFVVLCAGSTLGLLGLFWKRGWL